MQFTDDDILSLLDNIDGAIFAGQYSINDHASAPLEKLMTEAIRRGLDVTGFRNLDFLDAWPGVDKTTTYDGGSGHYRFSSRSHKVL